MRLFKLFLFVGCCFIVSNSFAQSPQAIEADLRKSFKKINYWDERIHDTTINAGDSLDNANNAFGEKLKLYTEKYPSTLNYPFNSLKKQYLNICSSDDGLFRIYSWDTGGGGTMREFENVMQCKTGNRTKSELLVNSEDLRVPFYSNLYTFKTGNKTYYLGVFGFIESSRYAGAGIKVFAIENNKLNMNVKLLKTQSGLKNEISYEYDFGSIAYTPFEKRAAITFDTATQSIWIPVVTQKGNVTKKLITYKFTGQYFEKVN